MLRRIRENDIWIESNLLTFLPEHKAYSLMTSLRIKYGEPARKYHTWDHITYAHAKMMGFSAYWRLSDEAQRSALLALLFHDYFYTPGDIRNETNSAIYAQNYVRDNLELGWSIAMEVAMIIVNTDHKGGASSEAGKCVLDADLFGLADPKVYEINSKNIREEFGMYTDEQWDAGRKAFLKSMLDKESIFMLKENKGLDVIARRLLFDEHQYGILES